MRSGSFGTPRERSTSSLYYSTDVGQVRQLYPELQVLNELGDNTRFIVSEPLRDLPGAWNEVPDGSWGVIRGVEHEVRPFIPVPAERRRSSAGAEG